jgi:mannosyltransferase OCH1-like enzyme
MLIPKIFHYIWLGDKPMHPLMVQWQKRWAALHPGWETKIWRQRSDGPQDVIGCGDERIHCRHPDFLNKCPTWAKRSDVWRYDILEWQGGVYLDTDYEPIKNIEPLIENDTAFAGRCRTRCDWTLDDMEGKVIIEVGCSLVGATPHHPWMRDLVEGIPNQSPTEQLSLAFPYITESVKRHPEVHLFEPDVFYPVSWDDYALHGNRALYKEELSEKTYAVHRWSSNWFANGLKQLPETVKSE